MNRAYLLNLIIEGDEDNIKIAKDICENTCKCGVTPTAITSKYVFHNCIYIYDVFKIVIKLLSPIDVLKKKKYCLLFFN
jgi:hypothetical protein